MTFGWVMPRLYEIVLEKWVQGAVLHGFNAETLSQRRYFRTEEEIERYQGELWLDGLSNVSITEVLDTEVLDNDR